jgi:AraC family transcriptional regulator
MEPRHAPGYLYGVTKGTYRLSHLTLAEGIYPPGSITPRHSHEHASICLVVRGALDETSDGRTRCLGPSTLFFLPPAVVHCSGFSHLGGRVFRVEISPLRLGELRDHSPVLDRPADYEGGILPLLASSLYREFQLLDEDSPLAVEGLVLEMLARVSRSSRKLGARKSPPWLINARELIRTTFAANTSLASIAAQVGVHPMHLASEFRRHFSSSIGEYRRQVRIEYAARQLSGSNVPIAEIALAAGFCDQSHFTKVFRRMARMSPLSYRAAFRKAVR